MATSRIPCFLYVCALALYTQGCVMDLAHVILIEGRRQRGIPPKAWLELHKIPIGNRKEKFLTYDLETQFDIVTYCRRFVHPPCAYLVMTLASEGDIIIEPMKKRIESETIINAVIVVIEILS